MADFCRRGSELLKEVVSHDPDSLSAYNVSDMSYCRTVSRPKRLERLQDASSCRFEGADLEAHAACMGTLAHKVCCSSPSCSTPLLLQEELVRLVFSETDEHWARAQAILRSVRMCLPWGAWNPKNGLPSASHSPLAMLQRVHWVLHCPHRESVNRRQEQGETQEEEPGTSGAGGDFQRPADAVAVVVHYESMSRNKRLLLSYMWVEGAGGYRGQGWTRQGWKGWGGGLISHHRQQCAMHSSCCGFFGCDLLNLWALVMPAELPHTHPCANA